MVDVLPLLPPETRITGCVGDGGSYVRFETTAGEARADIVKVCEMHAARQVELHASIPDFVKEPTTPASHHFYDREKETQATDIPGLPGVTLYLTTPSGPERDVRTDPWGVDRIYVESPDFASWDEEPTTAAQAAAYFRRLADLFDKLAKADGT
jgi:glycine/D-amino acid oxidase-like deaminating enzyme